MGLCALLRKKTFAVFDTSGSLFVPVEAVVSEPGWVRSWFEEARLTFQSDDRGAVGVQQGGQGTAVCVVLQQVLHQGEQGSAPLLSLLLLIASLKPWQPQRYRVYV